MEISKTMSGWAKAAANLFGINIPYIAKGGFFLTIGNIALIAVNFALAFFFARLLPKESYGTYSYILAWISVFGVFALPGMDTAVIQSVSRGFDNSFILGLKKKIKYGVLGSLAALIIGGYYLAAGNSALSIIFFLGAILIPFINSFQIYNAYLLGKKEFSASAYYAIASQIFVAAVLISTIYLTKNILYIVSAHLIANILPNFIFFIKIKLQADFSKAREDPEITSYAKHLSVLNLIAVIASYADKFLAWHFLGPANLANYAFATAPPEQIKGLFKALPDLALPKFSERNEKELKKTMRRKILILFAFTALVVAAYIIIAPLFYKIFFPRYIDSVFLSQIFALSLLNVPPALIVGALTAHKKIKQLYQYNIINPVFQIVIMAALTPLYGLTGLVAARIIARFFNTLTSLFIYYKL